VSHLRRCRSAEGVTADLQVALVDTGPPVETLRLVVLPVVATKVTPPPLLPDVVNCRVRDIHQPSWCRRESDLADRARREVSVKVQVPRHPIRRRGTETV